MGKHAGNRGNHRGFRATEETWETFLLHLETLSAIEVSKLPGMPSGPAFVKKRHRDPEYASRAAAIIQARKLNNSGRKRLTSEQWDNFLLSVGTCCVQTLCERPGMPSEAAVYKRRAADPAFAAELATSLRVRIKLRLEAALAVRFPPGWTPKQRIVVKRERKKATPKLRKVRVKKQPPPPRVVVENPGLAFQRQLSQNELYSAVMAAVPAHLNPIARDDIAADMMLAVLEGQIEVVDLKARAKDFVKQHWKLFGAIGVISMDAPMGADGVTLHHFVTSEDYAAAF